MTVCLFIIKGGFCRLGSTYHFPQEFGELARLFPGFIQRIPLCVHRGGKTNTLFTLKNWTMVSICMDRPEPEDIGSSVGALEEAHHGRYKHPRLKRMLQLMRTVVPECAAGKW